MIYLLGLLIIAAAAAGNANGTPRIVGGETTSIQRYPSLVQVEYRNTHLFWSQTCAANILNHQHLVTVAHCFGGFLFSINQRRIRAGSTFRNQGGTIFAIERYIAHPSYGKNDYDGDIAILKLTTQLTFGIGIQPVMIVNQGFVLFDNLPVTHAGWGAMRTGGGGSSSSQLRHVQVNSINHDECVFRYRHASRSPDVTQNMICTGIIDFGNRDTCDGDDGGPMYLNSGVLAGIVSWGRSCGDAYYPRVNTKIASYSNWIYTIIN